jgi:hypothetical protein
MVPIRAPHKPGIADSPFRRPALTKRRRPEVQRGKGDAKRPSGQRMVKRIRQILIQQRYGSKAIGSAAILVQTSHNASGSRAHIESDARNRPARAGLWRDRLRSGVETDGDG